MIARRLAKPPLGPVEEAGRDISSNVTMSRTRAGAKVNLLTGIVTEAPEPEDPDNSVIDDLYWEDKSNPGTFDKTAISFQVNTDETLNSAPQWQAMLLGNPIDDRANIAISSVWAPDDEIESAPPFTFTTRNWFVAYMPTWDLPSSARLEPGVLSVTAVHKNITYGPITLTITAPGE